MKTTPEELARLMTLSAANSAHEGDFLRAWLDADVFALVPLSDDHPRQRLIMFRRPDGTLFVPLFCDVEKALACSQGAYRLFPGSGRFLLSLSFGAVVIINPNDEHCTLYPEEVGALLRDGHVAQLDSIKLTQNVPVLARVPASNTDWLTNPLSTLYAGLPFVESAYVVEIRPPETPNEISLLIMIVVELAHSERASRASATVVEPLKNPHSLPVAIVSLIRENVDHSIAKAGVRFYEGSTRQEPGDDTPQST